MIHIDKDEKIFNIKGTLDEVLIDYAEAGSYIVSKMRASILTEEEVESMMETVHNVVMMKVSDLEDMYDMKASFKPSKKGMYN